MAKFIQGTASNADNLFGTIRAQLLANGWTELDILLDTVDNRDIVFLGTELTSGVGNAPIIRLTYAGATVLLNKAYADWDTTTHTGALEVGTTSTAWTVINATAQNYYMRANSVSFALAIHTATLNMGYSGFLRRMRPAPVSGVTKLSAGVAAGVNSLPVTDDRIGELRVGQMVHIINRSGDSTDPNWGNVEAIEVASVGASSVGVVGVTANAYSIGAFVGAEPYPNCASDQSSIQPGAGFLLNFTQDGVYTSTTGQTGTAKALEFTQSYVEDSPNQSGERTVCLWVCTQTTGAPGGTRGSLYHYIGGCFNGTTAPTDLIDEGDGVNDAIILKTALSAQGVAIMRTA